MAATGNFHDTNTPLTEHDFPMKCPTCGSPDPRRHPAVQFEGEVQLCEDNWHKPTTSQIRDREN
jgi:ubiquitin-protein ligase